MSTGPSARVAAVLPRAAELLDAGASYGEVARTLAVSASAIARHLPGRSSWTVRDGGVFVAACRAVRGDVRVPLLSSAP